MERLAPAVTRCDRRERPTGPTAAVPSFAADCNFLHLLANSPVATEAYLACQSALKRGRLTSQQRELIALAVAEINGSKYGLSAHRTAAESAGLTATEIQLARRATSTDPKNACMLRFARAVTLQRGEVSDNDFQLLRQSGFTDAEIAEIVANIGLNIFVDYFNNVVRTVVDFPLLPPVPDSSIAEVRIPAVSVDRT